MWIKTKDGDYHNMDHCWNIFLDDSDNTCLCFDGYTVRIPGDYRDTIVRNIISGMKILEV